MGGRGRGERHERDAGKQHRALANPEVHGSPSCFFPLLVSDCVGSPPPDFRQSYLSQTNGQRPAQLGRPRGDDARAADQVERRRLERRILEEVDREPALAHEELRRGDVDRAGGLQRADASTRPAARWQSERASEPMIRSRCALPTIAARLVGDLARSSSPRRRGSRSCPSAARRRAGRRSGTRRRRARPSTPRRCRSRRRSRRRRRPSSAPSATASESEKKGMPRFAFSEPSIGSSTTRHGLPPPNDALAELLRDEREVLVERLEPVHDRGLGGRVDRRRVVAALARSRARARARRGSAARPARPDVADRARGRTSSHGFTEGGRAGRRSASGRSRSSSAAAPRRGARRRRRPRSGSAAAGTRRPPRRRATRRSASAGVGGVRDPLVTERVDELDVEHSRGTVDDAGAVARHLPHLGGRRWSRSRGAWARRRAGAWGRSRGPGSLVETSTTSICALAGVPSSSWKATAVS